MSESWGGGGGGGRRGQQSIQNVSSSFYSPKSYGLLLKLPFNVAC